jgi:hypothetical protein
MRLARARRIGEVAARKKAEAKASYAGSTKSCVPQDAPQE